MRRNTSCWLLGLALNVGLTGSYSDTRVEPSRSIGSWETVDLSVSRRVGDKLTLTLTAVNALDNDPPFANLATGFDATNADPNGRSLSLQVTQGW